MLFPLGDNVIAVEGGKLADFAEALDGASLFAAVVEFDLGGIPGEVLLIGQGVNEHSGGHLGGLLPGILVGIFLLLGG